MKKKKKKNKRKTKQKKNMFGTLGFGLCQRGFENVSLSESTVGTIRSIHELERLEAASSAQEHLRADRNSQERLGAARSNEEQPGAVRSSQERAGAAKSSKEQPGTPRNSRKLAGAANRAQEQVSFHESHITFDSFASRF